MHKIIDVRHVPNGEKIISWQKCYHYTWENFLQQRQTKNQINDTGILILFADAFITIIIVKKLILFLKRFTRDHFISSLFSTILTSPKHPTPYILIIRLHRYVLISGSVRNSCKMGGGGEIACLKKWNLSIICSWVSIQTFRASIKQVYNKYITSI